MNNSNDKLYDVIGIGFGPSNLALAVAMKENDFKGSSLFIEKKKSPAWHEGMLLSSSDIQNNPVRDLISPINPRSEFTFINYLYKNERLLEYLNAGFVYPLRKEFNRYYQWVAQQFNTVLYNTSITSINFELRDSKTIWCVKDSKGNEFNCLNLVIGTGRNLNIPDIEGVDEALQSSRCNHLTEYTKTISNANVNEKVVVLGSSQSAVEIILDLRSKGFKDITSLIRGFSFKLKDTSPFSDKVYFPEFIDYFHELSPDKRMELESQVRSTNYSSADKDVLEELYKGVYEDNLDGVCSTKFINNTVLEKITEDELFTKDKYYGTEHVIEYDKLILATGFLDVGRNGKKGLPRILEHIGSVFSWNENYLNVDRDYKVRYENSSDQLPSIYLNGLCESSHGLGDAGSFSLVSYRARDILNSISISE